MFIQLHGDLAEAVSRLALDLGWGPDGTPKLRDYTSSPRLSDVTWPDPDARPSW